MQDFERGKKSKPLITLKKPAETKMVLLQISKEGQNSLSQSS